MNITLLINGEQVDFEATMSRIVKQAISEMSIPTNFTPEFAIEPNRYYELKDERVQKLFGVLGSKQPCQSIINRLRKQGIDTIKRGNRSSIIVGSQINDYFLKLSASQTAYLNKK